MQVLVNGEARGLHVVDHLIERDYAKQVVTGQNMIDTDELGNFCMTEEDYQDWKKLLAVLQESEDMRFAMKDTVDSQELADYIYEETKYLTDIHVTVDTENMVLKDLQTALQGKDTAWLTENGFHKTMKKL